MKIVNGILILIVILVLAIAIVPNSLALKFDHNPQHLTIMTFNGEFIWDGVEPEEGNANFPWKGNQAAAEARMAKIAQIIKKYNPDLVNLVEVENLPALTTLNQKFLANQGYHAYLIDGKDRATGQDVALLTKIKPQSLARSDRKGNSKEVSKLVTKNYYAEWQINQQKLALIGVHFLAHPRSRSRQNQRQAQADAIRQLTLDLRKDGYLPIILGDFNDYDGEIKDRNNHQPITNVLLQLKTLNTKDTTDDLINTLELIPQRDRYTSYYDPNHDGKIQPDREYAAIDFILIAQELKDYVESVTIDHSYDPRTLSDHFPIIVKLNFAS